CGPGYRLVHLKPDATYDIGNGRDAIRAAAELLRAGNILGVKGIGGYHLACNADDARAVETLRERKYRKEKPFAIMVRDMTVARPTVELTEDAEALLASPARPIVLAPAREARPGIAPGNPEIGIMLPYAPIHYLLFEHGAPERLVMTSGNRS